MGSAVSSILLGVLLPVVCANTIDSHFLQPNVVANRFIIEVDHVSSPNIRELHPLDSVFHQLKARDIRVQVTKEFKVDGIFNGAAVIVNNIEEDITLIENTPGVVAIRPAKFIQRSPPIKRYVLTGAEDLNISPDTYSTHILGGVAKVHAEGNIGTGVRIGIIDTGVDHNHPTLGSNGFGPGHKIVTGYDFVGDDFNPYDPNSQPNPDPDPMDCNGHGTHVAGIIAAEPGNPYNISGVAYGATLGAYKVFGCGEYTRDEFIVDALLQAVKDDMDILTLSLGNATGWTDSTITVVAERIAKNGKIVVASADNNGMSGSWDASEPAAATGVICVGSVDNSDYLLQSATIHGVDHAPIPYHSLTPLKINGSLPIYATSTDTSVAADVCSELPADTPDLSNYLVIIRRGNCAIATKLANAAAKGAKAMFIYDNGFGLTSVSTGNYTAAMILAADGEFLVKEFAAGTSISISFPQDGGEVTLQNDNGGLMSYFSSYGPSFEFGFKPAITAPGGDILSTFLNGSFAFLSGTSMSAPFAAGGAALLLAAKGKTSSVVSGARAMFETTSTKIPVSKNNTAFNTVSWTGAGLINVYNAIHLTTVVSPGELILNDTTHFQGRHIINVENIGDVAKQYTLEHVPALTALTMKENSILPSIGLVPLVSAPATAEISPSTFTVLPGASQQVVVSITPPSGLDAFRYPLYSGFVEVTSGTESYHVSYIGLAASLLDHPIFDNTTRVLTDTMPALLKNGTKVLQPTNFTFNDTDYPSLAWRLAMGTPALRIDLVDPNIHFEPTNQRRDLGFSGLSFSRSTSGGSFAAVNVIGSLLAEDYVGRHDEFISTYSMESLSGRQFSNGTIRIPNGQYRILMRALRITGDRDEEEDYDSWLSPVFGIYA